MGVSQTTYKLYSKLLHHTPLPGHGAADPGVGVTIQLTLPPQPARAAWWQPALLIHVARVWRGRNVELGADYGCDFCRPGCVEGGWRFCVALRVHGVSTQVSLSAVG
ncbi:MAG: hypothetical protein K0A89_05120 [ANME-2 cluster archaeon]|nr:hypothetical protein [ANME-2 cluster archaeon]